MLTPHLSSSPQLHPSSPSRLHHHPKNRQLSPPMTLKMQETLHHWTLTPRCPPPVDPHPTPTAPTPTHHHHLLLRKINAHLSAAKVPLQSPRTTTIATREARQGPHQGPFPPRIIRSLPSPTRPLHGLRHNNPLPSPVLSSCTSRRLCNELLHDPLELFFGWGAPVLCQNVGGGGG